MLIGLDKAHGGKGAAAVAGAGTGQEITEVCVPLMLYTEVNSTVGRVSRKACLLMQAFSCHKRLTLH